MWGLSWCFLRVPYGGRLEGFQIFQPAWKRAPELPSVLGANWHPSSPPYRVNSGDSLSPATAESCASLAYCLAERMHYFAGRSVSSQAEVSSNSEARRRISCFIYVCGLSAALDQEAVSKMRAGWWENRAAVEGGCFECAVTRDQLSLIPTQACCFSIFWAGF